MRGSTPMGRLEHAMGERGLGAPGGPLGQILGQLGGASGGGAAYPGTTYPGAGYPSSGGAGYPDASYPASGGAGYPGAGYPSGGGGGILGELAGMAGRHLGGGGQGGGGLGGGIGRNLVLGGLGALATAVLSGRGRGMGGLGGGLSPMGGGNMRGAMGAGGLALLAMLAMRALRNSGQSQAMGFANTGGGADPVEELPEATVSQETATLVLRAMIDAAKADGHIDTTERQKITAKLQESGADPDSLSFLESEMARPADPDGLAADAPDPVVAAQVYAASLLAIEVDTPAEQAYLRHLAGQLGLDHTVVAQLHQALGAPAL